VEARNEPHAGARRLLEHGPWLRRLALALADHPADADDLVQETWLAALERPPDESRAARSWMRTVARRVVSRGRRRDDSRMRRDRLAAPAETLPSTDELVVQGEMLRRMLRAVSRLDEDQRRTVLLRYVTGLSSAEIARRERTPGATVRSRLKRALDRIRAEVAPDQGDRHTLLALGAGAALATPPDAASSATAATGGPLLALKVVAAVLVFAAIWWVGARALREPSPPIAADPAGHLVAGPDREEAAPDPHAGAQTSGTTQGARSATPTPDSEPERAHASTAPDLVVRVVEPGGRPVPGVPLDVARDLGVAIFPHATVTTDAQGRVELRDLPASTYKIVPSPDEHGHFLSPWFLPDIDPLDHRREAARVEVPAGGTTTFVELVVARAAAIEGRVVDEAGEPVAGAHARLHLESDRGSWSQTLGSTDAQGRYRSTAVPVHPGRFEVVASDPRFAERATVELHPQIGGRHRLPPLVLRGRRASLAGQIVDARGEPVHEVVVLASDGEERESARTHEHGAFEIVGLEPGVYRIEARDFVLSVDPGPVPLAEGEWRDLGRLALAEPERKLTGRVRLEEGDPVEDARVRLGPYETRTDDEGRFEIRGDRSDLLPLRVRARIPELGAGGLELRREEVRLDGGPLDLVLRPTGLLFEILDAETGEPVAPGPTSWLSVSGNPAGGGPGSGGSFFLEEAMQGRVRFAWPHDPGPWVFRISADLYRPAEIEVDVRDDLDRTEQGVRVFLEPL